MREHTAAFKQWFADSKVIDLSGNPLVVFHGTPTHGCESNNRYVRMEQADVEYPQFDTFITQGGGITDSGWLGEGAYFASDADYAFEFGNFILPVYLRITRPFEVYDDSTNSRANHLRFLQSVQHLQGLPDALKVDLSMPADERGEELGRDYSRFFSMSELTFEDEAYSDESPGRYIKEAVAFHPTQIKSSIGNGGRFDPTDASILG